MLCLVEINACMTYVTGKRSSTYLAKQVYLLCHLQYIFYG